MFRGLRIGSLCLPLVLGGLGVACEGEDGRPVYTHYDQNLQELVDSDADLSTFKELISYTTFADALKGPSTITLLAPNNAAWSALPAAELAHLKEAKTSTDVGVELSAILRFNALGGTIDSGLMKFGGDFKTLTATSVLVEASGGTITIHDSHGTSARIVKEQKYASNGVLQVIDKVLIPPVEEEPPPPPPGTLAEELTAGGFATLVAEATRVGLDTALGADDPLTVFAPTDAAFTTFGDLTGVDDKVVENILLYHVATGTHDLSTETTVATLANLPLDIGGGGATVNGKTIGEEIVASNGSGFSLASVLTPPTAVEYVDSDMDLLRTSQAIMNASAVLAGAVTPDTLMGDSPITFFAPDQMAWSDAMIMVGTASTATLAAVIKAHTVDGQFTTDALTDGQMLTTLSGAVLTVHKTGTTVTLEDAAHNMATVTEADVRTLTGVVHIVDAILGQ